jgi:hypothetical protein
LHFNRYHSAPQKKVVNKDEKLKSKAKHRWQQLNSAIVSAIKLCQEKLKQDPLFKYPYATISNINEFNHLRHQFTIERIPSPSVTASLATAKSAVRRQLVSSSSKNEPPPSSSGLNQARIISKQAQHVLAHKEFLETQSGNKTVHQSLLNDPEVRKALFAWAAAQTPGEVSHSI